MANSQSNENDLFAANSQKENITKMTETEREIYISTQTEIESQWIHKTKSDEAVDSYNKKIVVTKSR